MNVKLSNIRVFNEPGQPAEITVTTSFIYLAMNKAYDTYTKYERLFA